jgi:hypothetical protein
MVHGAERNKTHLSQVLNLCALPYALCNPKPAVITNLAAKQGKVMTTGLPGGLITPYKGIVTDTP